MLLLLVGCAEFETPDGTERVRGALWVDGALVNADGAFLVVANSPVPCEAEVVPDDPATDADETASAQAWWSAQLQSALTREGAALLTLWLGGTAADGGDFSLTSDGWMRDVPGGGGAVSLRVKESVASSRSGLVYVNQPVDYALDTGLEGDVSAAVADDTAQVRFDVEGWSGDVELQRCVNPALATVLVDQLVAITTLG